MADASPSLSSRLRGSLYGLAVGDALGATYEFRRRGSYEVSSDMQPSQYGAMSLQAGSWTDDTSLALCLGASLAEKGEFHWQDVAVKMLRWYEHGYMSVVDTCFDIGITTSSALESYNQQLRLSPHEPMVLAGLTNPLNSGNGSLMRLAPIPICYHATPLLAIQLAEAQSRITHQSTMCLESCRLACAQIIGFLQNLPGAVTAQERKRAVLAADFVPAGVPPGELEFSTDKVRALRQGGWKDKHVNAIKTSGFVIDSHEAALWALWNSDSFEEGLLKLLPLGGDVDTVCAIYGQFAGACYGFNAIPERWVNQLQRKDQLESVFGPLVERGVRQT